MAALKESVARAKASREEADEADVHELPKPEKKTAVKKQQGRKPVQKAPSNKPGGRKPRSA